MKLMRGKYICPICNHKFYDWCSVSLSTDNLELDGNSNELEQYQQIVSCPLCGFTDFAPFEEVDDDVREFILSEVYQSVVINDALDPIFKKWALLEGLYYQFGDILTAGYACMVQSWYAREFMHDMETFNSSQQTAITYFEQDLELNGTIQSALYLIDLLRQNGNFWKAHNILCSIIDDTNINDGQHMQLEYEEMLINNQDTDRHFIYEIETICCSICKDFFEDVLNEINTSWNKSLNKSEIENVLATYMQDWDKSKKTHILNPNINVLLSQLLAKKRTEESIILIDILMEECTKYGINIK